MSHISNTIDVINELPGLGALHCGLTWQRLHKSDVRSTSGAIILLPSLSGLALLSAPIVALLANFEISNLLESVV